MPLVIKIFLVLSLVYCGWIAWLQLAPLLLPSPQHQQILARIPAQYRSEMINADLMAAGMRTAMLLVFFLIFGTLAAVARQGWARWLVALSLLTFEVWDFVYGAALYLWWPRLFHFIFFSWDGVVQAWLTSWSYWAHWITTGFRLTLIAALFAPSARPWFRHAA